MKLILRLALGAVAVVCLWQAARGARSAWYEYNVFHGTRTTPVQPPDAARYALRDVQFAGQSGATMRGWYLPSRTGAAVVLACGSESDRSSLWPYAARLANAGLGVLLFDWPGAGTSDGVVTMGEPETVALRNAVSFAIAQPDVTSARVGVLGFSVGSYISVLEASRDPRVRVLVLEGLFDNPMSQTWAEYAAAGRAIQIGGLVGDYLVGLRRDDPRASTLLPSLRGPRLLFVAGDADRIVPIELSRELFARANTPKDFWTIRGAGHGDYLTVDSTYGPRLVAFLTGALAASADSALASRR
jgi:uncharacterized protein